ncbi:asparagine synthase-related protein [Halomonas sp. BC04]|uniref:asparagine synthase-related protein n=1 Tax=Halomonas sp. BC04 TaxID=1403540 RepID=UPI0018CC2D1B|nr:asparagine synthase-related protein [Halomonas sp. BC04]
MVAAAAYRGPDGISFHLYDSIGFACLSLDVTADGSGACRPVVSKSRQSVFIADARLDNREQCLHACPPAGWLERGQAETSGSQSQASHTDAELMLGVLLDHGDGGVGRLVGDFAYALWSSSRRELRLARDPMGMRSLYYRVEPRRVLFATEISQLLAAEGVGRRLNEQAVAWHLAGMQVPAGSVFFEGVEEVKPGEEVMVDCEGRVRKRIYWQPDPANKIRYKDDRDYALHLRDLLIAATSSRLRSRLPVGISLSGGMDSGTVASVGGWLRERKSDIPEMLAYNWAFHDVPECDERHLSDLIARRYAIPCQDIADRETYPLGGGAGVKSHVDTPFTLIYQEFVNHVMMAAKAGGSGTILFGSRGDVLIGGEVFDFNGILRAGKFRLMGRELACMAQARGIERRSDFFKFSLRKLMVSCFSEESVAAAHNSYRNFVSAGKMTAGETRRGPIANAARHVKLDFLKNAGLPDKDPVFLAAEAYPDRAVRDRYSHIFSSIAMRVMQSAERGAAEHRMYFADVWSDRRIVEFVLACPQYVIHRMSQPKRLVRMAMEGIMPDEVIRGARKVSPEELYYKALRNGSRDVVMSLMTNSRCADMGYVEDDVFKERFQSFLKGERPCDDIWPTLTLEMWLRKHWS